MIYKNKGFTLVELIVAMGLTGIVMTGVYKTFTWQQNVYYSQDATASAQQDVRAGLDIMIKDLRMAGYCKTKGVAGITTADANRLVFTADYDDSGVITDPAHETITYDLQPAGALMRTVKGTDPQPIADNIDALDFVYLNAAGAVTADLTKITSVQVTIVANSGKADKNYTDKTVYRNQPLPNTTDTPGTVIKAAANDHLRRRTLTATVRLRNLGGL